MTVPEFLAQTTIPYRQLAEMLQVHISRIYNWKAGKSVPEGATLLRLAQLSGHTIHPDDLPRTMGSTQKKANRAKRAAAAAKKTVRAR